MDMNDYQTGAISTAIYPGSGSLEGVVYLALKMNGEAGEIAEKIGKVMRDKGGVLDEDTKVALLFELGDVLWYVAALAKEVGFSLNSVGHTNLNKLASRQKRGVLGGSGDDR